MNAVRLIAVIAAALITVLVFRVVTYDDSAVRQPTHAVVGAATPASPQSIED